MIMKEKTAEQMAEELGLELCSFTGECDTCQEPPGHRRVWVCITRAEETEVSYYICEGCLPAHYQRTIQEIVMDEQMADEW